MCSRFELNSPPKNLTRCLDLDEVPNGFTQGEIRPTSHTLCVGARGPFINRWGLKIDWDSKPLINARAETLKEKRTFQPLLNSRCLVPASAYFEWRREGKVRHKNRIAIPDMPLFSFAGLTDGEHVTIVTCQSVPSVAQIHSRMPVILSSNDEKAWIDGERAYDDVAYLVLPRPDLVLEVDEEASPLPPQDDLFG
jgi:putative SOS response-associated peptidase YedK